MYYWMELHHLPVHILVIDSVNYFSSLQIIFGVFSMRYPKFKVLQIYIKEKK